MNFAPVLGYGLALVEVQGGEQEEEHWTQSGKFSWVLCITFSSPKICSAVGDQVSWWPPRSRGEGRGEVPGKTLVVIVLQHAEVKQPSFKVALKMMVVLVG